MIRVNALSGELQGAGEPIDFEVIRPNDELPVSHSGPLNIDKVTPAH
jgi:hypothetical protein